MGWVKVKDDFLPNLEDVLGMVAHVEYGNFMHDGEIHSGVGQASIPLKALIEEELGVKIAVKNSHLCKGTGDIKLSHYIHADLLDVQYAMVLHLTTPACKTGTAFWKHKYTGLEHLPENYGPILFDILEHDSWNESRWEMTKFIDAKANRAVFFDSSQFHSRWPKQLAIKAGEEPRLTFLVFYDVLKPEEA